jgi:ABC-2 type transport system permease protein
MNFGVLFRKEIREFLKTYKLLIVVALLLFFGLSAPLVIKFLPKILEMSGEQIPLQLPTFSAADAIKSYLSTLGQIGLLISILVAMGSIAQERERRTAVMTLSKPAGFGSFITAKLATLALTFGIGLTIGAAGCYLYTVTLLGAFDAGTFIIINLLAALYLLVCLSITLIYSAFFRNQLAAGGMALVTLIILALLSNIPSFAKWVPVALMNGATNMASGSGFNAWPALVVSSAIVVTTVIVGWQVLKKREL